MLRANSGDVSGNRTGRTTGAALVQTLQNEVRRITSVLQGRRDDLARHAELLERSGEHLWLDPDEALSVRQLLVPRARAAVAELERAVVDARPLALAVEGGGGDGGDGVAVPDDVRVSVVEQIWEDDGGSEIRFTEEEMGLRMRDAKAEYDLETFRKWKRARR